jgi:hypothetical protein
VIGFTGRDPGSPVAAISSSVTTAPIETSFGSKLLVVMVSSSNGSSCLAALAAAFAMPVVRKTGAAEWLTRTRRDVVIIIDTSYSMAYETERGPVIDTVKEAAAALIGTLSPGDMLPLREIQDADLFDVSPVTYPAYQSTIVGLRSAESVYAEYVQSLDRQEPARDATEADATAQERGDRQRRVNLLRLKTNTMKGTV